MSVLDKSRLRGQELKDAQDKTAFSSPVLRMKVACEQLFVTQSS